MTRVKENNNIPVSPLYPISPENIKNDNGIKVILDNNVTIDEPFSD